MDLFKYIARAIRGENPEAEKEASGKGTPEQATTSEGSPQGSSFEEASGSDPEGASAPVDPQPESGSFMTAVEEFFGDLFQSETPEASNEQPTNFSPVFLSGVVISVFLLLIGVYLYSTSGDGDSQNTKTSNAGQQKETQEQVRNRERTPGLDETKGESVTSAFNEDPPSDTQTQPPSSGEPPSSGGDPNAVQEPDADPSNPQKYVSELREQNNRPPGAGGQGNPYQNARQSQGGSKRRETVKKAMTSEMGIETTPPGNFDPNKEGVPRNPASGRPVGSAPTPAETREEVEYQQDQQQQSQGEGESPREVLQERFPTGPGGGLSEDEKFLARQEVQSQNPENVTTVEGPFEPFVIPKGTIIPIVLESGANNKLPGVTKMRVSRDVYDRTMRHILIPKGSEIVSQYSTASQVGQDRVLVSANRLNLPDGRFVNFSDTRATGPEGFAGLSDLKDRHLLERFGAAGGLAVLGAVVNASNPLSFLSSAQQDSVGGRGGVIAGGGFRGRFTTSLSNQVNQIVGQLLQKQIDRQPTLELRPGLRGLLIINEDIDLKRPYYEDGGDFERQDQEFQKYLRKRRHRQMRRAIRRVQSMTRDRRRTQKLRQRARQSLQNTRQPSGPTSSRRPSSSQRASQAPQYYVDELRSQNRRGSTFIPPRDGATAREKYIFGPRYNPDIPPGKGSSAPPGPHPSDANVPEEIRRMRRKTRSAQPGMYMQSTRARRQGLRARSRQARQQQSYPPQETGNLNASGGPPDQSAQGSQKTENPSTPSQSRSTGRESPPPGSAESSSGSGSE